MLLNPSVDWNGKLVALDDGHGGNGVTPGKRTPYIPELGRQIYENEFNSKVVDILSKELLRAGFKVLLVAPTDDDTSLQDRVNLANANNADIYVSVHYNAFDGSFEGHNPEGLSVHIYPGSSTGRKLAEAVHKHLVGGTAQKDRGIKEDNFYVLRKTRMPAILTENGFMDNKREAMLMLVPEFQEEVAVEHAKGICDYFGIKYIPKPIPKTTQKPSDGTFYRVVTGSFQDRENAEKRLQELKKAGFESFLMAYKP